MIRSMTGYGRADATVDGIDISVEMKSVNNRYCEISVRLPRGYMALEEPIRSCLKQQINRGKVEVNVSIGEKAAEASALSLNEALLQRYLELLGTVEDNYGIRNDLTASTVIRLPEVFTFEKDETESEDMLEKVLPVAEKALEAFVAQREKEGAYLVTDILTKCDEVSALIRKIEKKAETLVPQYVEKLKTRTAELLGSVEVDEQRLLTEIAIMADRMAIDEEVVRFSAHTEKLRTIFAEGLASGEGASPSGKKIDFIIQEMNREINTVTSKIGDLEVTNDAIEIKTIVEKIREQLQNLE